MPTIYQAKMDGSAAVRYVHINLTGIYLGIAQRHAEAASKTADPDDALRNSVIGITFAVMAAESFANELTEDVIPEKERKDFERFAGRFQSKSNLPRIITKYAFLLMEKGFDSFPSELTASLATAIALRNKLVHYKLHDTAGKIYYPPPRRTPTGDGGGMISINFMERPTHFEAPFLAEITPVATVNSYNAARDVIACWFSKDGKEDSLRGFSRMDIRGDGDG